jgi:hypothetical protein
MTNALPTPGATTSPAAPAAASQPAKTIKPAKATKPAANAATKPAKKAEVKKAPAAKKAVAPKAPKAAAAAVAKASKEIKPKKPKLVRDSFTIPKDEYAVIETLKQRAATLAQPVKKSELLRAGLKVLAGLSDAALRSALQAVPSIKTGRPKAEVEAPGTAPAAKASAKSRK